MYTVRRMMCVCAQVHLPSFLLVCVCMCACARVYVRMYVRMFCESIYMSMYIHIYSTWLQARLRTSVHAKKHVSLLW